jgi:hypothetical protein
VGQGGSKPRCGVCGGEAKENSGRGSWRRAPVATKEEAGIEAVTEETGVEQRRPVGT